jgi:hypothetical protein
LNVPSHTDVVPAHNFSSEIARSAKDGRHGTISQCIPGLAFLDLGVSARGRPGPSSRACGLSSGCHSAPPEKIRECHVRCSLSCSPGAFSYPATELPRASNLADCRGRRESCLVSSRRGSRTCRKWPKHPNITHDKTEGQVLFRHGQVQSRMAPKSQKEIACDHLEPEAQQSKRKAGPDSRSRHQCNSKGFPSGRGIGHLAFWREQEYTVLCN